MCVKKLLTEISQVSSSRCLATGPQPPRKRVLQRGRYSASSCKFQYLIFFLRSSSYCLHLPPLLPVTSIFPSTTQNMANPVDLSSSCRMQHDPFSPWLDVMPLFSRNRPRLSYPASSITTFQNFPGISAPISTVSKFQNSTILCSKYNTSLVSLLNLSTICWWKQSSSCWMLLLSWEYYI